MRFEMECGVRLRSLEHRQKAALSCLLSPWTTRWLGEVLAACERDRTVVAEVRPLVTGLIDRRSAVELQRLQLVLMSGGVPGPRGIVARQSGVDHCLDVAVCLEWFL